MVQAVQHGRSNDGARGERIVLLIPVRDLLVDTLMGSSLVVIRNVLSHQTMQDEHIVQAFPFQTANKSLADTIGLGRLRTLSCWRSMAFLAKRPPCYGSYLPERW